MPDPDRDVMHLVRLALDGKTSDVAALAKRIMPSIAARRPELSDEARAILAALPTRRTRTASPVAEAIPVDADTRLRLLRRDRVPLLEVEPIWRLEVLHQLEEIVSEFDREQTLADAGLSPTRSALLVGPPGVGKTMAARWLAVHLRRPLLTLDLSAVMSSFLGRTGNNIRVVLDYAKREDSVLLLDEFDAVAKRRDDATEIGELKRLVTVLLQEVDDWPASGLLLAATNHPQLLDPAIWRRFDRIVTFPEPNVDETTALVTRLTNGDNVSGELLTVIGMSLQGKSFADVTREILRVRRSAVLQGDSVEAALRDSVRVSMDAKPRRERLEFARALLAAGWSQREASAIAGVSRDTIRKHEGTYHGLEANEGI